MPDGDPAEGADEITDLHVENVDEAALKGAALQEDSAAVLQTLVAVHDHVDLGVGACTPHISSHHLHVVYDSYKQMPAFRLTSANLRLACVKCSSPIGCTDPTSTSLCILPSSSSMANHRFTGNSYTSLFPMSSMTTCRDTHVSFQMHVCRRTDVVYIHRPCPGTIRQTSLCCCGRW